MDIKKSELSIRNESVTSLQLSVLFVLRLVIGWHFLYEGLIKLLDPNWTSSGFLIESRWIFAELFHWIAATPIVLKIADLLNIWGLIFIGLGLFFGCFTRIAGISGILMLFLYYIAIPPLPSYTDRLYAEGNYLIISKNLVELISLCVVTVFPTNRFLSIDGLLSNVRKMTLISLEENGTEPQKRKDNSLMKTKMVRREILKSLAALPVFGAFVFSVVRRHGWESFEEKQLMEVVNGKVNAITSATMKTYRFSNLTDLKAPVAHGRIGNVKISRIICGGNLISGFGHARDLIYVSSFLKQYFTDEKVMDTLRLCEACGINTAILRTDPDTLRILAKYRKRGGNIQWLAQTYPKESDPVTNIQIALDNGAVGAFIQGNIADRFVRENKLAVIEKAISYIKGRGVIAGIAGHHLRVPLAVEDSGIDPDFYMKTLHCRDYWSYQLEDKPVEVVDNKSDNYWCIDPEKTIEYMSRISKPWIAYKVLAAGAIHPKDGFRYTFENGADFACVGMFDFQIIDNVNTAQDVLSGNLARKRSWMA